MHKLVTMMTGCLLLLSSGCCFYPATADDPRLQARAHEVLDQYFVPEVAQVLKEIPVKLMLGERGSYGGYYNPFADEIALYDPRENPDVVGSLLHEYGHAIWMRGLVTDQDAFGETIERLREDGIPTGCSGGWENFYFFYQENETFARLTASLARHNSWYPDYLWRHFRGVFRPQVEAANKRPSISYAFALVSRRGQMFSITSVWPETIRGGRVWVKPGLLAIPFDRAPLSGQVFRRVYEDERGKDDILIQLMPHEMDEVRIGLLISDRSLDPHLVAKSQRIVFSAADEVLGQAEITVRTNNGLWVILPLRVADRVDKANDNRTLTIKLE